jgi:hypothetical protein
MMYPYTQPGPMQGNIYRHPQSFAQPYRAKQTWPPGVPPPPARLYSMPPPGLQPFGPPGIPPAQMRPAQRPAPAVPRPSRRMFEKSNPPVPAGEEKKEKMPGWLKGMITNKDGKVDLPKVIGYLNGANRMIKSVGPAMQILRSLGVFK